MLFKGCQTVVDALLSQSGLKSTIVSCKNRVYFCCTLVILCTESS